MNTEHVPSPSEGSVTAREKHVSLTGEQWGKNGWTLLGSNSPSGEKFPKPRALFCFYLEMSIFGRWKYVNLDSKGKLYRKVVEVKMGEVAGKEQINANMSTLILPRYNTEIKEDKGILEVLSQYLY